MLVTDGRQLIRCPVHDIRKIGRNVQGVTIFKTSEGKRVVSVERINEEAEEGANRPLLGGLSLWLGPP